MKKNYNSIAPWDTADYASSLKEAGLGLLATLGIKLIELGGKHPKQGESSQVRKKEVNIINLKFLVL